MAEAACRGVGGSLLDCPQAAPARPQDSQSLLSGLRAASQPAHAECATSRRPQVEQKSASASGRRPQRVQDADDVTVTVGAFDDVAAEARRSARTLAVTRTSMSSKASASDSWRKASRARAVYLLLRNS